MSGSGGRTVLMVTAGLILIAVTLWAARREPEVRAGAWPSPEEIDSMGRYLEPVEPAPDLEDYAVYLPAAEPPPRAFEPPPPPEPEGAWRVSAILIAGDRPMAIINDRHVRPGESLEGGARVESIARDHVVIRQRNGSLRTLRLPTGNG